MRSPRYSLALLPLLLLCACSSSSEDPAAAGPDASLLDAGSDSLAPEASIDAPEQDSSLEAAAEASLEAGAEASMEASPSEASIEDAPAEASQGFPSECLASCAQTDLTLTFGTVTRGLDRAQLGFDQTDGGVPMIRIEAHFGGDSACPSESSPTPDRTVIFANIPLPQSSEPIEGTPVTLLDFSGDLTSAPLERATQVKLIPVAAKGQPKDQAFAAFEVEVSFSGGSMRGHLYATHCDSLDE